MDNKTNNWKYLLFTILYKSVRISVCLFCFVQFIHLITLLFWVLTEKERYVVLSLWYSLLTRCVVFHEYTISLNYHFMSIIHCILFYQNLPLVSYVYHSLPPFKFIDSSWTALSLLAVFLFYKNDNSLTYYAFDEITTVYYKRGNTMGFTICIKWLIFTLFIALNSLFILIIARYKTP